MATTTQKVQFLTGSQENLNNMTASLQGAFYLTNDSHRLYVGTGSKPVLLNKTVQPYNTFAEIAAIKTPTKDDFYYAKQENILCIYDPTSTPSWIQINPNTNTGYRNTEVSMTLLTADSNDNNYDENNVTYKLTIVSNQYKEDTGTQIDNTEAEITTYLTLTANDIAKIVPVKANVGLTSQQNNNGDIILNNSGNGANQEATITFKEGSGVSFDFDSNVVTINAPEQTISSDENSATIKLSNLLGTNESAVEFTTDTNGDIVIDGATKDNIKITHKTYTTPNETGKNNELTTDQIQYVTGVTVNNGHITGVSYATHEDKNTEYTIAANKDGISIDLIAEGTDTPVGNVNLTDIVNTITGDRFAELQTAVQYKGTADQSKTLTENPSVGHMYMVALSNGATSGTVFEVTGCKNGDLLIYNSDNEWELIPSGDELWAPSQYINNVSYGTTEYSQSIQNSGTPSGNAFKLIPGTNITFDNKGTISHSSITTTGPTSVADASSKTEFTAITGITTNNGHITAYTTEKFIPQTYQLDVANDNDNNKHSFALQVPGTDTDLGDRFTIKADGVITAQNNNGIITIGHVNPTKEDDIDLDDLYLTHGDDIIFPEPRFNGQGHFKGWYKRKLVMPKGYDFYSSVRTGSGIKIGLSVTGTSTLQGSKQLEIYSLNSSLSATGAVQTSGASTLELDLVWQSF